MTYIEFLPEERRDPQGDLGQKVLIRKKHVLELNSKETNVFATIDDLKTMSDIS